jgi:GMP reductase
MVKIETNPKLDFKDVLIRPKRSAMSSRSEVDLTRKYTFGKKTHTKKVYDGVPIIASNMDTTGTFDVYETLRKHKIITIFNKFYKNEDYEAYLKSKGQTRFESKYCGVSTGIFKGFGDYLNSELFDVSKTIHPLNESLMKIQLFEESKKNFDQILKTVDPYFICIDVANGYTRIFVEFCEYMSKNYSQYIIIAGNVATREITEELILNRGVDIVKVGIGPGSACTTRLKTGVGIPQLSAIIECADAAHGVGGRIIGDGGITCPGDMAKAFCAGADFVMVGGQFAGHDQNPGVLITDKDNKQYKSFYGMSSTHAQEKHYGKAEKYRASEGRVLQIPYKGDLNDTVYDYLGGLRSTCTYIGASSMREMSKCATFVIVGNQLNNYFAN